MLHTQQKAFTEERFVKMTPTRSTVSKRKLFGAIAAVAPLNFSFLSGLQTQHFASQLGFLATHAHARTRAHTHAQSNLIFSFFIAIAPKELLSTRAGACHRSPSLAW